MAAKKGGKKAAKKGGAKKGGAKKAAKKGGTKKAAKKKGGAKRTPNAAFMRPMQPDAALGAVVGNNPIPRTEITKKLWPTSRRTISKTRNSVATSTPTTSSSRYSAARARSRCSR